MECKSPVHINILTSAERGLDSHFRSAIDRPIFRRCGKCFACQCTTRAEWAYRAAVEKKNIDKTGFTCFVTLTYDNKHLPTIFDFFAQTDLCKKIRNKLVSIQESKPILQRKWDFSVLRRSHLSDYIKRVNDDYKKIRYDGIHFEKIERVYFDKSKGKKRVRRYWRPTDYYLKTYRFVNARVYATGEYGTFSHRCHFHILMFCPFFVDFATFRRILEKNWTFGAVDVDFTIGNGAISYVAKHQIKEDFGNIQQSKISPLVRYVSVYQGGLGVAGVNTVNYNRYNAIDVDGNYNMRFFEVPSADVSKSYKVAMPKYYLDKFWRIYCDYLNRSVERSEFELNDISRKSEEKFKNFLVKENLYSKFVDENFLKNQRDIPDFYAFIQRYGREYSNKKRSEYFKKQFAKKKLKIARSQNFKFGFSRKLID